MAWSAYDKNGEKHEFSNKSERDSWIEHNEGSKTGAQKIGENIFDTLSIGYNGHSSNTGHNYQDDAADRANQNNNLDNKKINIGGKEYDIQGSRQDAYITLPDGTTAKVDYDTGGLIGGGYNSYMGYITGENERAAAARKAAEEAEARRKAEEEQRKAEEAAAQRKQDALKLEREAREAALSSKEASAKNAYTAARNTGLNRQASSAVGAYSSPNSGFASNYSNLQSAKASTAADFLNKMGYVNGLNQQASNLQSGAKWNTIGAALSGAGEGAQVGAALTSNSSR